MLLILDLVMDRKFEHIEIFRRFFGKKIPRKNAVGIFDFEMNPRLRGVGFSNPHTMKPGHFKVFRSKSNTYLTKCLS